MARAYNGSVCMGIVENTTNAYIDQVILDGSISDYLSSYPIWVYWNCQKSLRILACADEYEPAEVCQDSCYRILAACDEFIQHSDNYDGYNFSYPDCAMYSTSTCSTLLDNDDYPTSTYYDSPSCPQHMKLTNAGTGVLIKGSQCGLPCPSYGYSQEEFDDMTDTTKLCTAINIVCFSLTLIWLLVLKRLKRDPVTNKPISQVESSRRVNVRESEFIIGLCVSSLAINVSASFVMFLPQNDMFCEEVEAPFNKAILIQDTDLTPSKCEYQGFFLFYFTTFSSVWLACQAIHMSLVFQSRYDATLLNKLKLAYRLLPVILPLILMSALSNYGHFGIDINLPFPYCNLFHSYDAAYVLYLYSLPNVLLVSIFVIMVIVVLVVVFQSLRAYYNLKDTNDSASSLLSSSEAIADRYSNIFRANIRLLLLVSIFGILSLIGLVWQVLYQFSGFGEAYDDSRKDFETCLLNFNLSCGHHPNLRVSPGTDEMLFIISTLYGLSILFAFGPGVACLQSPFRMCGTHQLTTINSPTNKLESQHPVNMSLASSSGGSFTQLSPGNSSGASQDSSFS